MIQIEPAEIERFRVAIEQRFGFRFDESKLDYLAGVLRECMEQSGIDRPPVFIARLVSTLADSPEASLLAGKLSVPETYFFRHVEQFEAFAQVALLERARARAAQQQLRLLSAGCASGEEAYTLAILLRERAPELSHWDIRIQAIDMNSAMLEKGGRGVYSDWALRETPPDVQERWFTKRGRERVLDESIRKKVSFEKRNLIDPDPGFWAAGTFDIVFLRNVTMYFATHVTQRVVERVCKSLAPGGFLFLGHAETLRGVSQEFHLRHSHSTFYYQRKTESNEAAPASMDYTPAVPATQPLPAFFAGDTTWVDAIQNASAKIAALARGSTPLPPQPVQRPVAPRGPSYDLGQARELLRQERFADALGILRQLPVESSADTDAQLLHAVVLTSTGDMRGAEELCARILKADELNAGAHYVMALCREHSGDNRASAEYDKTAAYLDPGFAMPHLHLGLMAKRERNHRSARNALEQALLLLAREDSSRILLFGGGFRREALMDLCCAELRALGSVS